MQVHIRALTRLSCIRLLRGYCLHSDSLPHCPGRGAPRCTGVGRGAPRYSGVHPGEILWKIGNPGEVDQKPQWIFKMLPATRAKCICYPGAPQ